MMRQFQRKIVRLVVQQTKKFNIIGTRSDG